MNEKLFDILTNEELSRIKIDKQIRNVRIKDLTLEELENTFKIFWPISQLPDVLQVVNELKRRKAL